MERHDQGGGIDLFLLQPGYKELLEVIPRRRRVEIRTGDFAMDDGVRMEVRFNRAHPAMSWGFSRVC